MYRFSSSAGTPSEVIWPPSQYVSSVKQTLWFPCAAARAAATPPKLPPATRTSQETDSGSTDGVSVRIADDGDSAALTLRGSTTRIAAVSSCPGRAAQQKTLESSSSAARNRRFCEPIIRFCTLDDPGWCKQSIVSLPSWSASSG